MVCFIWVNVLFCNTCTLTCPKSKEINFGKQQNIAINAINIFETCGSFGITYDADS